MIFKKKREKFKREDVPELTWDSIKYDLNPRDIVHVEIRFFPTHGIGDASLGEPFPEVQLSNNQVIISYVVGPEAEEVAML